jgi:hypothetical protein
VRIFSIEGIENTYAFSIEWRMSIVMGCQEQRAEKEIHRLGHKAGFQVIEGSN